MDAAAECWAQLNKRLVYLSPAHKSAQVPANHLIEVDMETESANTTGVKCWREEVAERQKSSICSHNKEVWTSLSYIYSLGNMTN